MRVLITGASGFAGRYLAAACTDADDTVVGASRSGPTAVDLRDGGAVRALLRDVRPEVVYHLAALSHVGRSWDEPQQTLQDNIAISGAVLEAARHEARSARVVWVSSCQVYGSPQEMPVDEEAPLHPDSPYAVSKTAGEMLASVYADAYGMDIVRVRPFNHTGPGQRPSFIVSSLARQAAQARVSGASELQIVTGNPETRRDFTDVRDVVRAYRAIASSGARGQVYNVSSDRSISPAEQVRLLSDLLAPIKVVHEVDPARVRAHEAMDLRGSFERLRSATGWEPTIPFRQTMLDTIEWWERELAGARHGERVQ